MGRLVRNSLARIDANTIATLDSWATGIRGLTVGIIYGGVSYEDRYYIARSPRDQMSITALIEALDRLGADYKQIDPTLPGLTGRLAACDVIFPNLHGEYGEDGRLQGLLDYLRLPYVGSGVPASAIGADKDLCKQFMKASGIRTPQSELAAADGRPQESSGIDFPLMVKPAAGGSSIGMSLVRSRDELTAALETARQVGAHKVLLEQFIPGRSVSVPVLDLPGYTQILSTVSIDAPGDFYDAESKLDEHGLGLVSYAEETERPACQDLLEEYAMRLWQSLDCRGFARVDFIIDGQGRPWALEINTVPGLSRDSNFAVAARKSGLTYDRVIVALLREALARVPDNVPIPRIRPEDHVGSAA